jgi:hypothetical protein
MVREPDEQEGGKSREEPEERRERRERRESRKPREPEKPRDEDSERRPWGARVLAPVAFFTAVVVLVLLVNNSLSSDPEASPSATTTRTVPGGTGTTTGPTTSIPRAQRRFYRIQTGDTLEAIAERFDTTVDDLLTLNPGIDANSLTPGQRIRIK